LPASLELPDNGSITAPSYTSGIEIGERYVVVMRLREGDVSGVWETDFGPVRLEQRGAAVQGSYASGSGSTLEGTLSGNTLSFTWKKGARVSGTGTLTFDAARTSFTGSWQQESGPDSACNGRRAGGGGDRRFLIVLEAHWEKSLSQPER
jgi:hypothetical protein